MISRCQYNENINNWTMKNIIRQTTTNLLFIITVAFSSCQCWEEPGIVISETRNLEEFTGVHINSIGKVNLYAAEEYKIIVKTHDNIMNDISLIVTDKVLEIKLTGNHNRIKTLEFDVFAPYFNLIQQEDVASIICIDGFSTDQLQVIQNDVGDIKLYNLSIDQLDIDLNDVGDIEISGIAHNTKATLKGVGDIRLFEVNCLNADINLSGTGDIEINASEQLSINLSGVGSVYYKGSPTMSVNNSGVGKIINVN